MPAAPVTVPPPAFILPALYAYAALLPAWQSGQAPARGIAGCGLLPLSALVIVLAAGLARVRAGGRHSFSFDNVGAPAWNNLGQAVVDQDPQRLAGRRSRDAVFLDEAGDRRQSLTGRQLARFDARPQDARHLPVRRDVALVINIHILTVGDLV